MAELIRDTAFGRIVRVLSRRKYFSYAEERQPELWKQFVHHEKTKNVAHHGQPEPESDENSEKHSEGHSERNNSQSPLTQENGRVQRYQTLTGHPVDAEHGKDLYIVDWYGDDDPENPMNWSTGKKVFVTFEICFLTFSVYIGSAIYSAGIVDVMEKFGVSQVAASLGLTLFVAGYGTGPMIWAPLSEIPQFGRTTIYISTLAVFVLFQIPTALATNFGMLLAFRFLTGFIGSPSLATGGASLQDMYAPKQRAYAISCWGIGAVCGPVLGPLVGGFAAEAKGWTWTIWELMWLSGFALVVLFFFLPETSSSNILYRRTLRLRKLSGNQKLRCESELESAEMTWKDIASITLVRPFSLNLEPVVFALNLYIALIYGLLYIWFESFPIVFVGIYKFSLGISGLAFIGILVGAIAVVPPFFLYLKYYLEKRFDENGNVQPEQRLPPAIVGAFCIPICMFWFGWSARPDVHWIMPIIGSAWFSVGAFLLFNSILNYLGDAYPKYAASVLAGNDLMRSSFGAGFPLFATAMYHKLGVGWASSLLGFLACLFIPIPFVLFKYGKRLRMASKRARHDI